MLNLKQCQEIIDGYFRKLELPSHPANLYEPVSYMLCLEGKRLRPSLVLMACNVFSQDILQAIYPAMAIEVFHNFTLVHDDIMDESVIRRNQPTVHVKWNSNIALLSGDAMLIKAYELLSQTPKAQLIQILPLFNQMALQVCEGQQFDMDFEKRLDVTIEDYLMMIERKTALLLAASLKIGAIIGGADKRDASFLYEFGRNIGMAFQLQDDLLDVYASSSVLGKETGHDILTNKKTILLVEALNIAKDNMHTSLVQWIQATDFKPEEKIQAIRKIYDDLGLEASTRRIIREYHTKALSSLEKLKVQEAQKSELILFSEYLMNRVK
jgi:geranylgeranyl diphosphate synthase type II